VVNAKFRQISYVCQPFFANQLAALYSDQRFFYSVWKAGGRRLLLVKQAQERCGDRFANPPANGKQAPVIFLNITSVPHWTFSKITPSY